MDDFNVYDFVTAATVEDGDCIFHDNDYIEVKKTIDDGMVMVVGYSHVTGDTVTYVLDPDAEVGLWTV